VSSSILMRAIWIAVSHWVFMKILHMPTSFTDYLIFVTAPFQLVSLNFRDDVIIKVDVDS